MNHNQNPNKKLKSFKKKAKCRQNSELDAKALLKRGYQFGGKIAKGAFGQVVKAKKDDSRFAEPLELACKYVNKTKAPKEILEKFLPREIEILSKISHPNIIGIQSILQSGNTVFFFMEYAKNGDLLEYINENGAISEPHAKLWFFQLTSALKHIHGMNYAHRDLKCENILISKHKNVKLADFGFARKCVDDNNKKILSETFCGSKAYAAPEIILGLRYDPMKSDVWSLGVILFVMLNIVGPFDESNVSRLIHNQLNRGYKFRPDIEENLSYDCRSVVQECLDPNPDKRIDISELYALKWLEKHVHRISIQA